MSHFNFGIFNFPGFQNSPKSMILGIFNELCPLKTQLLASLAMMSETFFYDFSTLCWLVFPSNFAMLLSPFSEASWGSRLGIEQKRIIIIVRQSMGSSRRSIISHLRNPGGLLSSIEPSLFAKTALNISKKLTHRWTVSHWCTPGLRDQIDSYRHL